MEEQHVFKQHRWQQVAFLELYLLWFKTRNPRNLSVNYLSILNKTPKICEIRTIRSKASIRILLVMGKNNVPEGWEKYSKCGRRIPGTPFVAFKVPLSENLQNRYNQQFLSRASRNEVQEHRWTLDILRQTFDLNLVIDLTATDR